ncbi:MAG: hypothetical protein M1828_004774 [Chrysothrix sp. TS-e1954]|nr:MAG: hypothetical protein M1828_004774 [Chrysothrix sp. TS-e1954]
MKAKAKYPKIYKGLMFPRPVQSAKLIGKRYWQQRYTIFSRFDDGIWLTEEAWYGVTPEPVADAIAADLEFASPAHKTIVIDAFAGVGGNAIALAKSGRWEQVFAIEKDLKVLNCAKHNAEIYGVGKKIWFIHGDCFEIIPGRLKALTKNAVIFASPPWGGTKYRGDEIFDLNTMQPYNIKRLHSFFSKWTEDFVMYLPRSADLNQIARFGSDDSKISIRHYCIWKASKALCAFFGGFSIEDGI